MDPLIRHAAAAVADTLHTFKMTVRLEHKSIDCLRVLLHNVEFTAVDEAHARDLVRYRAVEGRYSGYRLKDLLNLERTR